MFSPRIDTSSRRAVTPAKGSASFETSAQSRSHEKRVYRDELSRGGASGPVSLEALDDLRATPVLRSRADCSESSLRGLAY